MIFKRNKPKVGLALGGGGARGCAHIGVIQALEEANIAIEAVGGTSIGSIIGGIYTNGNLPKFTQFLLDFKKLHLAKFLDLKLPKRGLIEGDSLIKLIDEFIDKKKIEEGKLPFVAVATQLNSAQENHFTSGDILKAIRASIALPGLITPYKINKNYYIDGGVTNPIPIDAVRNLGADIVIGVDLNSQYLTQKRQAMETPPSSIFKEWFSVGRPNIFDVLENSVYMMQEKITQGNLAQFPADFLIKMPLQKVGILDFHKADYMIKLGYDQTKAIIPNLKEKLKPTFF